MGPKRRVLARDGVDGSGGKEKGKWRAAGQIGVRDPSGMPDCKSAVMWDNHQNQTLEQLGGMRTPISL